jgi:hypothetical protein
MKKRSEKKNITKTMPLKGRIENRLNTKQEELEVNDTKIRSN